MSYNDNEFKSAFMLRVKTERERHNFSLAQMALILGISKDTYRKYESVNMMPQRLIPLFARAVGRSIEFMYTGEEGRKRG